MIEGTITAKPQVFAAAVKWAAKFLDARPSVPVWAGLMLDAADGTLRISSMNEYVSATATLSYEGTGKGRVVVSGRLLDALVATFADKPVTLAGDGGETLAMSAGRWKGTLPCMDEDDYPAAPGVPEPVGVVSGEQFARAVAEVATATSKDPDAKPPWKTYMHLTLGEAEAQLIASDAYRAAGTAIGFEHLHAGGGETVGMTALLRASVMVDVAASFIGPDEITVGLSPVQLAMSSPSRSVVVRLIDEEGAQYPAGQVRTLLATEQPEHAIVKVADLVRPLKRAELVKAKDGPVAVGFTEGTLTIASKADALKQDGAEEVDVDYTGPDTVLHFNPKYFGDAVSSAPGELVDMALTEKTGPNGRPGQVVLTVAGSDWRHVLMPIKPIGG